MSHQHQHSHGPEGQTPQQPGANPQAIEVAKFLRGQELKCRTCILNGQRKDLFKVKRALRALQSDAYKKACSKNKLLPPVETYNDAQNVFRLLPMNLLALRVSKIVHTEDDGHGHGKLKRVKGLWDVKIEQEQIIKDDLHYMWFYEGPQWKTTVTGIGMLIILLLIVLFPLWPPMLRLGVWYLSMGILGLVGLLIVTAIFRLILFVITMFALSPGIWLFPNLFEDVGFFDSFKPLWAWEKVKKPKGSKKAAKAAKSAPAAPSATVVKGPPKAATVEEE